MTMNKMLATRDANRLKIVVPQSIKHMTPER